MTKDDDRAKIRAVIEANIGNAANPHSWRCENPDRFPDYCKCVDVITDEVLAALEPEPVHPESWAHVCKRSDLWEVR